MIFFQNYVKSDVFYKLLHLEFLNHQVRARFFTWVILGVDMDWPLFYFFESTRMRLFFKITVKLTVSCEHRNFLATHGSNIYDSSNYSSIPLLQNHAVFMKFYLRLLWLNRLAKCAIFHNTPGIWGESPPVDLSLPQVGKLYLRVPM